VTVGPTGGGLFAPARIGPLALRNRVIKCATNEGMSRDGLVTDRLVEFHREFAAGGVGATTLAYCSVSAEGRTYRHQVWMREEARATGRAPLGPSRTFSPYAQTFSRAMDEAELARVRCAFADAARLAVRAGFDALEVHVGHGYLLSQFLTPWNNRRRDAWGGSLENRARFPREVLRAVREAAPDVAVWAKLNMDDGGFRGGLAPDESLEVARWLEADGSVDALQLTGGHTSRTPMFLMRGDVPLGELIRHEKSFVRRWGMRLVAPRLLKAWPFEEAFFLPTARRFLAALRLPLILLGGLNRRDTLEAAVAEGFAAVALGRALIRDPDLVLRMQRGELDAGRCSHCNRCIVEMERGGTRCVERPGPP
jgi:2,4-dienoyl-CoA reductase-like NADH-dependent reductase (Old Yellow Enzyme family)